MLFLLCEPRFAVNNRKSGKDADCAPNPTQQKALTKATGVTGETILYRLYDLCNFDPVYDQVVDAMHALVINLIRTELSKMLRPIEENVAVELRDTKKGGVLKPQDLNNALKCINWTSELKDGRLPYIYNNSQSKLGQKSVINSL